ncbi:unnamed protein product [Pedinophyceae sp. YPF-701]|nr:unnamed protein product [Pedinophyceae sp. YPF-701]
MSESRAQERLWLFAGVGAAAVGLIGLTVYATSRYHQQQLGSLLEELRESQGAQDARDSRPSGRAQGRKNRRPPRSSNARNSVAGRAHETTPANGTSALTREIHGSDMPYAKDRRAPWDGGEDTPSRAEGTPAGYTSGQVARDRAVREQDPNMTAWQRMQREEFLAGRAEGTSAYNRHPGRDSEMDAVDDRLDEEDTPGLRGGVRVPHAGVTPDRAETAHNIAHGLPSPAVHSRSPARGHMSPFGGRQPQTSSPLRTSIQKPLNRVGSITNLSKSLEQPSVFQHYSVPASASAARTASSAVAIQAKQHAPHGGHSASLVVPDPPGSPAHEYSRVITPEVGLNNEQEEVAAMLLEALQLRDKYLFQPAVSPEDRESEECACLKDLQGEDPFAWDESKARKVDCHFEMVEGVFHVWDGPEKETLLFAPPSDGRGFFGDLQAMMTLISRGPVKTYCHHRLLLLEQKFNLHLMLNQDREADAQKKAPHRDFYNVRKVDTHIHHSAAMHQKHLLRFIKSKLKKEPDQVVIFRDGKYLTLKEVFESLNLSAYDLNVDMLDMHADKGTFHRFDKFNLKYNPCGQSRLREIFIKQDNLLHGRFLAELTKELITDLEASKYQHAEWRISIYGRQKREWDTLAAWVVTNRLSSNNVLWMIQIPRLFSVYKEQGLLDNFQQFLDNIFEPLFEVTRDPSSHPHLHMFLTQVTGFDMVDDESKPERRPSRSVKMPQDWDVKHNPAYSYYAYFVYANLYTLNHMREARGLNTFSFRPHCGEAGDIDHLVAGFLLAEHIAHGINLRKSSSLQHLYYLAQIGLHLSPLSNNSLFLDYHRNPLPTFFARGLNVSLSSDDPLQIHLTKEPLVEEYSVAAQVWKFSSADLCEMARNSVLQSGVPHELKMHWVGTEYWRPGPAGNDIQRTNVPDLRLRFRADAYTEEMNLIIAGATGYHTRKQANKMDMLMDS